MTRKNFLTVTGTMVAGLATLPGMVTYEPEEEYKGLVMIGESLYSSLSEGEIIFCESGNEYIVEEKNAEGIKLKDYIIKKREAYMIDEALGRKLETSVGDIYLRHSKFWN